MYFIYVIENLVNGKMYVGQTINLESRRRAHFSPSSKCPYICNAVKKYGKENFDFVLLEALPTIEISNEREKYWIEFLGTLSPRGYNLRYGGDAGGRPSQETIEKVRKGNLGRIHSEEEKERRAASLRGRKNTPETIERMRFAAKNKPPEKCSMFGKKRPQEWIERCRQWSTKTHCKRGHPLDGPEADVYIDKNGKRDCRACKRERRREDSWNNSNFSIANQSISHTRELD